MSKIPAKIKLFSTVDMYTDWLKKYKQENPTHTTKDLNSIDDGQILDENGKVVFTYHKFKEILKMHNKLVGDNIIKGKTYNLGNKLGNLFIARKERNSKGQRMNRGESFKLRKKLKETDTLTKDNWKVYYVDDDYCSLVWHKTLQNHRNVHLYNFKTAGGQPGRGFRQQITRTLNFHPEYKGFYPYLSKAF
jgi:hypothetical protein